MFHSANVSHSFRNANTNGKYPVLTFCGASKATLKCWNSRRKWEELSPGASPVPTLAAKGRKQHHRWCQPSWWHGTTADTQGHRDAAGHLLPAVWDFFGKGLQTGNTLGLELSARSSQQQVKTKQFRLYFISYYRCICIFFFFLPHFSFLPLLYLLLCTIFPFLISTAPQQIITLMVEITMFTLMVLA